MQPTDPTKFTERAYDAILKSQEVARKAANQNLEVEHVAIAMLEQQDLAAKIFTRVGVDVEKLTRQLQEFTSRQPRLDRVVDLYLGRGLDYYSIERRQHEKPLRSHRSGSSI
jgi:ATP-dependent Clp protease ATP-binding subunit ClpB